MSSDEREFGRVLEKLENLEKCIDDIQRDVGDLKSKMTVGRGFILGIAFMCGGALMNFGERLKKLIPFLS